MAIEQAASPTLGPYEILRLLEQRRRVFAERNTLYELYQTYYRGKSSGGRPSLLAANSQGRPLLRDSDAASDQRVYSSQRLAPIVDDFQALLGRMPTTRVEPPSQDEQGEVRAELLTKYLISTHELSRMDRQQAEMGYYLPCLGDGCYLLEVDPTEKRVVWTVVDPSTAYPSFMSGHRRFDVLDLIVCYQLDPFAARIRWGNKVRIDEDAKMVEVTLYISPHQRTVVVGDAKRPVVVNDVAWDLNFCPAVWVFNKINGHFANSDIAQSLVQQDALDFLSAVFLDGVVQNTYPIIGVKNPINVGSDPPLVGPGAPPIPVQGDGDIIVRQAQGDLGAIRYGMQTFMDDIYAATGTTQARQQGDMHSSIVTGRAMHAAQGPQATRIELKQIELGAAIQIANSMTLQLQEKAPFIGSKDLEIYGRFKGQAFREMLNPKRDINGWHRNRVSWEPVTGMNLQQKTAVAYEGMMAGLWDDNEAMNLAGVDDPPGMRERIRQQKLHDAKVQSEIQSIMQPPQPGPGGPSGGPPPGGPGGQAPPPPPQIKRPSGLGAPAQPPAPPQGAAPAPPPPQPKAITFDTLSTVLAVIADKLRGTVWVTGALAAGQPTQHLDLLVSDTRDYPRVVQAVRPLDPTVKVRALPESKMPPDAVKVS